MRTSLDSYLGIHPQALTLESQRNEMLAANLANVDTPNYKARDIDFKSALASASAQASTGASGPGMSSSSMSSPGNSSASSSSGAALVPIAGSDGSAIDPASLKYRVPMAPSLDGNTVDEQLEQSAFAENTVRYQATLQILNTKLHDLMTAITGS
jgi:flagellar basal-body rod protein FlgB